MGTLAGVETGALEVQTVDEVAPSSPTDLKAFEIQSPRQDPVRPNFETDLVASGLLQKMVERPIIIIYLLILPNALKLW